MRRATAVAALGVASIAAVEPYTGSRAGQPAAAGGDSQREAYTGPRPPPASTTAMGAIAGCSRRAARLGSPAARRQSSAAGGVPAAADADAAVGRILRGRHQAAAFRAGVHRAPPPPASLATPEENIIHVREALAQCRTRSHWGAEESGCWQAALQRWYWDF